MLLSKLAILSLIIYLSVGYIRASYGKDNGLERMQKIADSLRVFKKEDRLDYVRFMWRFCGYFGLIFGVIFFLIVLITGGETIHIKIG